MTRFLSVKSSGTVFVSLWRFLPVTEGKTDAMLNCQRFLLLTIRTPPNVEVAGTLYTGREQEPMHHYKPLLFMVLLICAPLAGCLESSEGESVFDFVVNHGSDKGMIVETYDDGNLVSIDPVVIVFDFSQTTSSSSLTTFGLSLEGEEPLTLDASEGSSIAYSFDEHGVHNVSVFAIDATGATQNLTIPITVDLRIEWSEEGTNDPMPLPFNPTPNNGGVHPLIIEINSTVENPSLIDGIGGGGQTVQFSWNIVDELDDTCQSKSGQAEDGSDDTWNTIHFNTYLLHELRIVPEDGQDFLNIQQSVTILYTTD